MQFSILPVIKMMRPHHYVKNIFIFLPLFFALKITEFELVIDAIFAFIAFSLIASAIYILNDYRDIEEDRLHPKKRNRPLASGAISKRQAILIMMSLFIIGFGLIIWLSPKAAILLFAYAIMNIAYSFQLKHVAIVDISIIATGFVLRLFVGAAATNIHLSMWIVLMTFLLALFMALAKRRDDVLIYQDTGRKMRKVIDGYNLQFLDTAMSIMASVVIVAYIMYTTSPAVVKRVQSEYLYLTAIFVVLGILRYMQIAFVHLDSGSPTKIILKDSFVQLTIFAWIVVFFWILY